MIFKIPLIVRQANYEKSKKDLWLAKKLLKTQTIPQAKYDEMWENFEISKADLAIANKALHDTLLRAPFAGVIAKTYINNFQNIRAKEPVVSLQDISHFLPKKHRLKKENKRRALVMLYLIIFLKNVFLSH